ncbi:hypothetical protein NW762_012887 [Fusarium torreyae]|uniref:Uncharacterized protein n=1 Tax=Fusarium torreyae TaxID=1237075 RepID=A0A9W8RPQ2_9HYPO|nr:hypothetical protein NW762_012887 [Fusarium torreyae]
MHHDLTDDVAARLYNSYGDFYGFGQKKQNGESSNEQSDRDILSRIDGLGTQPPQNHQRIEERHEDELKRAVQYFQKQCGTYTKRIDQIEKDLRDESAKLQEMQHQHEKQRHSDARRSDEDDLQRINRLEVEIKEISQQQREETDKQERLHKYVRDLDFNNGRGKVTEEKMIKELSQLREQSYQFRQQNSTDEKRKKELEYTINKLRFDVKCHEKWKEQAAESENEVASLQKVIQRQSNYIKAVSQRETHALAKMAQLKAEKTKLKDQIGLLQKASDEHTTKLSHLERLQREREAAGVELQRKLDATEAELQRERVAKLTREREAELRKDRKAERKMSREVFAAELMRKREKADSQRQKEREDESKRQRKAAVQRHFDAEWKRKREAELKRSRDAEAKRERESELQSEREEATPRPRKPQETTRESLSEYPRVELEPWVAFTSAPFTVKDFIILVFFLCTFCLRVIDSIPDFLQDTAQSIKAFGSLLPIVSLVAPLYAFPTLTASTNSTVLPLLPHVKAWELASYAVRRDVYKIQAKTSGTVPPPIIFG